jgi:hypothetical protein
VNSDQEAMKFVALWNTLVVGWYCWQNTYIYWQEEKVNWNPTSVNGCWQNPVKLRQMKVQCWKVSSKYRHFSSVYFSEEQKINTNPPWCPFVCLFYFLNNLTDFHGILNEWYAIPYSYFVFSYFLFTVSKSECTIISSGVRTFNGKILRCFGKTC